MISIKKIAISLFLLTQIIPIAMAGDNYKNLKVAVYSRAYETVKMGDNNWIEPIWEEVTRQLKVDKIYLETHRDLLIVDEPTLLKAKKFFESRGVKTAGGITLTVNESNNFETFCYTNPDHRKKVKEIVEFTATHFDELILDDFFFTTCKCELCIHAMGTQSWTDYRLASEEALSAEQKEYPQRRKPAIIKNILNLELKPHSYVVLKLEK